MTRSRPNSPRRQPYGDWLKARAEPAPALAPQAPKQDLDVLDLSQQQAAFGFTKEEIDFALVPMVQKGEETVYSMGTMLALSVLSTRPTSAQPLLQAAVRPGHQPADRPDPRARGDVARRRARLAAQLAGRDAGAREYRASEVALPVRERARNAQRLDRVPAPCAGHDLACRRMA